MIRSSEWPSASSAANPKIRSAAGFQSRIFPSVSAAVIASPAACTRDGKSTVAFMEDLYSHGARDRHDACMKAAERVTCDRRETVQWAELLRSGDPTPLSVPRVDDEAVHHRTRAREDALLALKAAKSRLIQADRRETHDTAG